MSNSFSSNSVVWVDGQVTLPFIVEDGQVRIVNSAEFAMSNLKKYQQDSKEAA